jgi:hypothetical protein
MIKTGYFVITDITGYTAYLSKSELDHAQETLQSLYDAQLKAINLPMVVSNFQGDAILSYIPEDALLQKQTLLELVEQIYFAFTRMREMMQFNTTCTCNACKNIPGLDLKIFVHYGQYLVQKMAGREELVGSDVILAHRMMKNKVVEQTDLAAYALFTKTAADSLDLEALGDDLIFYQDSYEHVGTVDMFVHNLKAQWEKEKARSRNVITKEEAWVSFEIEIDVPPSVVWDYVTKIDVKLKMVGFTEGGRTDNLGGRIDVESSFHCAHGELQFRYQVVDWKPFEYFTCYESGLNGLVYYNSYHMVPTKTGTLFANYVLYPESGPADETKDFMQDVWNQVFPNFKTFIEQGYAKSTNAEK